jgi:hypothetical protein
MSDESERPEPESIPPRTFGERHGASIAALACAGALVLLMIFQTSC